MTDHIAALMHADPAFAAGGGSFSSGLERLAADGWAASQDELVERMVEAVSARWNPHDRVYLVRALTLPGPERVTLDLDVEASTPGQEARSASRRAGSALLATWARLGLAEAVGDAESLSCWAVLGGYASSAVRLGVIGHRGAQEALLTAHARLSPLLERPVADDAEPWTFTPLHDIAIERHALSDMKLFAS